MWGAYRGFFDNNIQADWVHIDDIDAYDTLYAPYPIMLTAENAAKLAAWVEAGGTLISEACPGYFGDRGRVGTVQPNNGLDAVFGAREVEVEFMPDIADRIRLRLRRQPDHRRRLPAVLRADRPARARGDFADGRLAVVENTHGKGRTLLVGTHPSVDYYRTSADAGPPLLRRRLRLDRQDPARRDRQPARSRSALHEGDGRTYLWFVNATREPQAGSLVVRGVPAPVRTGTTHWAADGASFDGRHFTLSAARRPCGGDRPMAKFPGLKSEPLPRPPEFLSEPTGSSLFVTVGASAA